MNARDRALASRPPTPDLPAFLQVEITSHCNLKCGSCPLTSGSTASSASLGHISESTWNRVLEMASQVKDVVISGFGEPFIHPSCVSLIRKLDARGVRVSLSTNGTLLSASLCEQLVAIPHLTHINVSLDSADPEVYERVRRGKLDRALEGLRRLMTAIDDPWRVTASSVITAESAPTLRLLPPLLGEIGVRRLVLQSLAAFSPTLEAEDVADDDLLRREVASLRETAARHMVEIHFSQPERFEEKAQPPAAAGAPVPKPDLSDPAVTRQCGLPWEVPFIDKDGRVFPCCLASSHPGAELGDLRQESLEKVWNGDRYQEFRHRLLQNAPLPDVCRGCNVVPIGPHPLREFAAEVRESRLFPWSRMLRLRARNIGTRSWERTDNLRIGTTRPRDRVSAYHDASWLGVNRIGTFREDRVAPGETATFEFRVHPHEELPTETFQLVLEGKFWLPNTSFEIGPGRTLAALGGRRLTRLRRLAARVWRERPMRRVRPERAAAPREPHG